MSALFTRSLGAGNLGSCGTVVALHGFTGSGLDFESFINDNELANYHWLTPDFLGHGESPAPREIDVYSLESCIRNLNTIFENSPDGAKVLLGYSMGGRIALHWVLNNPGKFRGMILVGASPGVASESLKNRRIESDDALADRIERIGVRGFLDEWNESPIIKTQKENIRKAVFSAMQMRRLNANPVGWANSLRGLGTGRLPSLWNRLSEVQIPVLLLTGETDKKFFNIAQKMSAQIPECEHCVIPNAGHMAHLEGNAEGPVLEFLKRFG